jgi:hypothetical protein
MIVVETTRSTKLVNNKPKHNNNKNNNSTRKKNKHPTPTINNKSETELRTTTVAGSVGWFLDLMRTSGSVPLQFSIMKRTCCSTSGQLIQVW